MSAIGSTSPNAAASASPPAAIVAETDGKQAASAAQSQPVEARTAVAAGAALAAAQSDRKQELDVSNLYTFLKMVNPALKREVLEYLPLFFLRELGQLQLVLMPAKQAIPPTAVFQEFLPLALSLPAEYSAYCKNCKLPDVLRKLYEMFLQSLSNLKQHPQIGESAQTTFERFQPLFPVLVATIKTHVATFSRFWEETFKQLEDYASRYERNEANISKNIRLFTTFFQRRDVAPEPLDRLNVTARRLLSQYKLFGNRHVPYFRKLVAQLESSYSTTAHQIQDISRVVHNCEREVSRITAEVVSTFTAFECYLVMYTGTPLQSKHAIDKTVIMLKKEHDAYVALLGSLKDSISVYLNEPGLKEKLAQAGSAEGAKQLFRLGIGRIDAVSSKGGATPPAQGEDVEITRFLSGCDRAFEAYRDAQLQDYAHPFCQTESESPIMIRFKITKTMLLKFVNILDFSSVQAASRRHYLEIIVRELTSNIDRRKETDLLSIFSEGVRVLGLYGEARTKNAFAEANAKAGHKKKNFTLQTFKEGYTNNVSAIRPISAAAYSLERTFQQLSWICCALKFCQETLKEREPIEAHECLDILEQEEQVAEQLAFADAQMVAEETDRKQASAVKHQAKAAHSPQIGVKVATARSEAVILKPDFNSTEGHFVFNLRSEFARWHGVDDGVSPASFMQLFAARRTPEEYQQVLVQCAQHQHVFSNCNLSLAVDMLHRCIDPQDQLLVSQMVMQWGYLAVEQSTNVELFRANPRAILAHNLKHLLHDLGITGIAPGNQWIAHARRYTLYQRHPFFHEVPDADAKPFCLQHLQAGNAETTRAFQKHLPVWMADAATLQAAALGKSSDSRIKQLIVEFQKAAAATGKEEESKRSAVSSSNTGLEKAAAILSNQIKNAPSSDAKKTLLNAQRHLENLRMCHALWTRFPQQRFMHVILHQFFTSAKNFCENLGIFLSIKSGAPRYTHSLFTYGEEYDLGRDIGEALLEVLQMIDVEKGDEYPFKYFANTPEKDISKWMMVLSEFYMRSQEALLLGEGAVPAGMKHKKMEELLAEVNLWAKRFTDLVCALVTTHLS